MRRRDNDYDLAPESYKALSSTSYSGKTMKGGNDISMMNIIIRDSRYTGFGARKSKRKTYFTITLPILVDKIRNKTLEDNMENCGNDLQGGRVKIIIPSNMIDIYARFKTLLGLKLSCHTDTLTEASTLIDELYKRGEIINKQPYRNALDKFQT